MSRLSTLIVGLALLSQKVWACNDCSSAQKEVVQTRLVRRMQTDAQNATTSPRGPLAWGQVNFLQTTDTHGWLEGHLKEPNYGADWGDFVSFTKHMRQKANDLGVDLLLIDSGVSISKKPGTLAHTCFRIFMTVQAYLMQHRLMGLFLILFLKTLTMIF
jgi:2',3'-cyclic-nucleotide 2'-phosphodiesterase (5'-nucleotidase family)